MKLAKRIGVAALILFFIILVPHVVSEARQSHHGSLKAEDEVLLTLIGRVINTQNAAIDDAEVRIYIDGTQRTVTIAGEEKGLDRTRPDGFFILDLTLPEDLIESDTVALEISRSGYRTTRLGFAK